MFSASLRPLSITVHWQNYSVASFGRPSLSNNRKKNKHTPLRSVLSFLFFTFRSIAFCCFATV